MNGGADRANACKTERSRQPVAPAATSSAAQLTGDPASLLCLLQGVGQQQRRDSQQVAAPVSRTQHPQWRTVERRGWIGSRSMWLR